MFCKITVNDEFIEENFTFTIEGILYTLENNPNEILDIIKHLKGKMDWRNSRIPMKKPLDS